MAFGKFSQYIVVIDICFLHLSHVTWSVTANVSTEMANMCSLEEVSPLQSLATREHCQFCFFDYKISHVVHVPWLHLYKKSDLNYPYVNICVGPFSISQFIISAVCVMTKSCTSFGDSQVLKAWVTLYTRSDSYLCYQSSTSHTLYQQYRNSTLMCLWLTIGWLYSVKLNALTLRSWR